MMNTNKFRLRWPFAFLVLCVGTFTVNASLIADLRTDYDAHTPVNGRTSIGKIADTLGTGSWNFYSSATVGSALEALTCDTTADADRTANTYTDQGQVRDMPGIANHQVFTGQGGNPPSDSLALHPGRQSQPNQYLLRISIS